ncbi:hypothetical protein B9Z55_017834 [Caenorhabditis nigoni]|uniref:MULE transposase domain-containing protein n=1 Tax=Caenorhabditis nigoni TaxID=1611254 RepID=A0A2G5TBB6_9PELO|nr:hypothetical protein B9Z55_017834 [Caenorhabditis nigoni]
MAPRKNKPIIQVKGFAMRLQKKNQNGTELYYCVERERRARCDAAYVLDKTNNTFLMRKPHTRHDEDYAYLVRQALKKNANNGKPREVIDDVRDQFSTVASVACGSYDAKRKMIALAKGRKEEDVVEMDKGGSIANVFALTKDFETALKNAFESQFPRSNVQGCLFHLVQCWRRKAEKLKCYDEFIKGTIQDFWVRIKSIPFIVPTETKQYFDLIVSTVPTPISANVQTFIDYLVDYYIDDTVRFPPKMWSCAERTLTRIHRTTNVVESWHKVLTCVHSQKNGISPVLLSDILVKLKAEEMHTKKDWEELKLNPNFQVNRNRKLTNALKDARLIKTLENLPIPPNMPLTGLNLLDAISDAHSV